METIRAAPPSKDRRAAPWPFGAAQVVWRRSARARRVGLRIDARAGAVVVTVPARARRDAGRAFLMSQAEWVGAQLAALPPPVVFRAGGMIAIGGEGVRIRHDPGFAGDACLADGELLVGGDGASVAAAVGTFLRGEARRCLVALVTAKAAMAAVQPRRVAVKDTRTRWGSCAPDGTLAFSWRLVMAPAHVVDYVTGHEVAHLRHMNHGAAFWRLVETLTPHRAAAVAWLAAEGPGLLRVG